MNDPWIAFEDAMQMEDSDRRPMLEGIRDALGSNDAGLTPETAELQAAITSELARLGALPLSDALGAVEIAGDLDRRGWPNYYLAQAAIALGDYGLASSALGAIPARFFEDRDLLWRQVHCWEMAAIARMALGEFARAESIVEHLSKTLVERGDSDDLLPPNDLVNFLLSCVTNPAREWAVRLIRGLAMSIDVDGWFDESIAHQIHQVFGASSVEGDD